MGVFRDQWPIAINHLRQRTRPDRAYGKTNELRQYDIDRAKPSNPLPHLTPEQERPRFKDIWKVARTLREIKKLSDEAHELVASTGKAIVIANPAFAVALFIASALSFLLTLIGGIVALTSFYRRPRSAVRRALSCNTEDPGVVLGARRFSHDRRQALAHDRLAFRCII